MDYLTVIRIHEISTSYSPLANCSDEEKKRSKALQRNSEEDTH